MHEAVHTITHADRGFFYTLKNLTVHPGAMQKDYLRGERTTNQKPFSLFFICAGIAAIALHFVNAVPHGTGNNFDLAKEKFYKNYFVIFQTLLLPFYALITWVTFTNRRFNYAEVLVFLCTLSALACLFLFQLIFCSTSSCVQ
ncbi:MAG: DUF3667 domain-containing protein [Ginsengibacter sp.]